MTEQDILYKSTSDATALAENSEGLRYGAPGWSQAKIEYAVPPDQDKDEKYFFISANGMNETDFQKWQKYVGEKFEANGLKFHYL